METQAIICSGKGARQFFRFSFEYKLLSGSSCVKQKRQIRFDLSTSFNSVSVAISSLIVHSFRR